MNPQTESIEFTRVNNDVNGNPRYVFHFYALVNDKDREQAQADQYAGKSRSFIDALYTLALKRAKSIGGRKFHNKQYGGGICISSYNIAADEKKIHELMAAVN